MTDERGDRAGGRFRTVRSRTGTNLEEIRRRNASAVAMDALYLATAAFLASLAARGFWPAVIAALPLAAFLSFAWKSSSEFFVAQLVVIALAAAATYAGFMPI